MAMACDEALKLKEKLLNQCQARSNRYADTVRAWKLGVLIGGPLVALGVGTLGYLAGQLRRETGAAKQD